MNKDTFIKEIESRLNNLNIEIKNAEIKKINDYITAGISKGIEESKVINSLGTVDDIIKTIYIQNNIKTTEHVFLKDNVLEIWNGIKKNFLSKDRNLILRSLRTILLILLTASIIKIPFIFIRTLFLDGLNTLEIPYIIQNIFELLFELSYIVVAFVYIYKSLKKYFVGIK